MGDNEVDLPIHDLDLPGVLRHALLVPGPGLGGGELPPGLLDADPHDGHLQRGRPAGQDAGGHLVALDRAQAGQVLGHPTRHDSAAAALRGSQVQSGVPRRVPRVRVRPDFGSEQRDSGQRAHDLGAQQGGRTAPGTNR